MDIVHIWSKSDEFGPESGQHRLNKPKFKFAPKMATKLKFNLNCTGQSYWAIRITHPSWTSKTVSRGAPLLPRPGRHPQERSDEEVRGKDADGAAHAAAHPHMLLRPTLGQPWLRAQG